MQSVYIDFDGTITPVHGFSEDPKPEVINTINEWYDSGEIEVVIYSCRANPEVCDPDDVQKMVKYLRQNGIRYHRIEPNKPHFRWLVDDRALNPNLTSWQDINRIIQNKS